MFVACEETEGVADPYTDWEARNQAYIDSIAEVAKNNPAEWKVIRSYKLPSSFTGVNDNIYCKVLKEGTGGISPIFTDVALPVQFTVNAVITGWTTALQQMKAGDRWEVYIPSDLAYGDNGQSSIPGFSTLIFDMTLVDVTTDR